MNSNEIGVKLRKKIKQLAYGKFDYDEPELQLSTERIELEAVEGAEITGEFKIHGGNGKKLRGIVYSTYPRMECLTPQFEGEEVQIRYQFHSEGMEEGDVRKGEFVIVCDQGEYNLSFVVSIFKSYPKTSVGVIKHLSDFVRLAREHAQEAYQVFYSVRFPYLLKEASEVEQMLYEAIRKDAPSMQAMEAYLVGIGKKQPVQIFLDGETQKFTGVTESKMEQVNLRKDGWGYFSCDVKADAAFIKLEKTTITSEDFVGSTCFYQYYIDAERLHAGNNFGRILFEFPEQILAYEICVTGTESEETPAACWRRNYFKDRTELAKLYIDYRTRKIVTGVWAKNSVEVLDRLLEAEPENDLYKLMKAQAYLVNRQRQDAAWIMEAYKRSGADKKTPEWGYYLYLCTLVEREEAYVDRLAEQIEEIFRLQSDNSLLFWILLFVREDYYKNNSRRLKAIERWIENGCDSPFFYIEALYLYWQDPYLLTKLEGFEIKILNWARKYDAISKEIAVQILKLMPTVRNYDEKLFRILENCYQVTEKEEAAAAICSYLIKGQRFAKKYHKWYAIGVESEARITNLYEAYLLSADKDSIRQVPKVIFMYFQYHNTLSYKQLALLYAYLILNKEKYRKIYQNYRQAMEQFAVSQIEAEHMDENLAVVYKEMLPLGILNGKLAEHLAEVLFVHKLQIIGEKTFARVLVVQKQWKRHQVVQIVDGVAYFKAYTEDYSIVLCDAKGKLFAEERFYEDSVLLDADAYLEEAVHMAPLAEPYLVHLFDKKQKADSFGIEDKAFFSVLMDSSDVSESWKAKIQPAFVRHMVLTQPECRVEGCLADADYNRMSADDRRFMIEQLIENQMFEQAYELLCLYGYDMVKSSCRMKVSSYKITESEYEEDEFLVGFANSAFLSGKYDTVVLGYLCKHYNGPTKHMAEIWQAAREQNADTADMEERIITQMLYSTDYVEQIDAIYSVYCKKGSNELLDMAYLSYFSQLYLVKDAVISNQVFSRIEIRITQQKEVADVSNYALLKHYAELETLTDGQYTIADMLLSENTCHNIYFSFYKKLDAKLQEKYCLQDKVFVEYYAKAGTLVHISYCINEEALREEEMPEVYEGIFVKPFVLFYGDRLLYYVSEMDEQKERKVTASGELENAMEYEGQSCYAMLDNMYRKMLQQEDDAVKELMGVYQSKKASTEAVFRLL